MSRLKFIPVIILGMVFSIASSYAQDNSLNKSFKDLKNAFAYKRILLYPATDTNSADFQSFHKALLNHSKVNGTNLTITNNGTLVEVNTRADLNLLWISIPKEIRNRYRLGKRDENDIIRMTDLVGSSNNDQNKDLRNTTISTRTETQKRPITSEQKSLGNTNWATLPNAHKHKDFKAVTEIEKTCISSKPSKPIRISVAPFFISAGYNPGGRSRSLADSLIGRLGRVACFATFPEYVYYVPGGSQVLITGDVKDYYTSEKKLGKPRLHWLVELRNASDFEIITTKEIKIEGELYKGTGYNAALDKLWEKALLQTVSWVHSQSGPLAKLKYATETDVALLDTNMLFRKRVETEGMLESQQRYGEAKRERNRKRGLGLSEYYNDTAYLKTLPAINQTEFIEYTIDGKKYKFYEGAKKLEEQGFLSILQGQRVAGDGLKVTITSPLVVGNMTISLSDPSLYPTIRRFHFGSNPSKDSRVPDGYEEVYCLASLMGGFKEDKFTMKRLATEKALVIASNIPGQKEGSNVTEGFLQILHFETGSYGVLEAMFEFKTKSIKDVKSGKEIPARKVTGRFRVRGNISPPIDF